MALTPQEKTQITAIVTREGGLATFAAEVQAAQAANAQTAALQALNAAVTMTVSDWAAVTAAVAGATNQPLYQIMTTIGTKAATRDATQLGPLLVALYAATKAHLSL